MMPRHDDDDDDREHGSRREQRQRRRERSRSRSLSASRSRRREQRSPVAGHRDPGRDRPPPPSSDSAWGKSGLLDKDAPPPVVAAKPNFALSGKLAAEQNTFNGVVLKYSEPGEACKPSLKWRLHVFKGKEQLDVLHIYKQSAYLIGRDRMVVDIPVEHPSCSKQHAVIQHRQLSRKNEYGEQVKTNKPYVLDIDSTNGTFLNGERIEPSRYYELQIGDVVKFGESTREYVVLHEEAS
ncbi:hypothetical protein RI367_002575 [Sorochytrium milnesiophthora]